ncbi:type IX secretion system sortase PorU [Nonlabens antarcticus]|uniref:type IX secretion system sortase PorU n=1 Tax=Nonlabens antarcticus TaxID=392714 RepID=UPI00189112DC|nr:type IX secretion system sortase PorU [Nonlabens antarcticus]
MRQYLLFFFLILWASAGAQSENIKLEWTATQPYSLGGNSMQLPSFSPGFGFDEGRIIFSTTLSTNGKIDPLSARFTNLNTVVISSADLGDLDKSSIPNGVEMTMSNALSRKRNYIQLQFNAIYKEGNQYRKVMSMNVTYSMAPMEVVAKSTNYSNSLLASGDWYKFKVTKTGAQRITRGLLNDMGINVNAIDPRAIKIYGQGGTSLPLINSQNEFYDPAEVSITVTGADDGSFDNGDEIIFYGVATDSEYVAENDSFINPYTDESFYYINVSGAPGKRILPQITPAGNPTATYNYYQTTKHHELDQRNIGLIGRIWYGERFTLEPEQSFDFEFKNPIASRPATVRIPTAVISDVASSMTFSMNGQALGTTNFAGLANDNTSIARRGRLVNNTVTLSGNTARVTVTYDNRGNPGAQGFLDYISIDAFESLAGINEQFTFTVPEAVSASGIGQYQISNAAGIQEIWEVTDRFNVSKIENTDDTADFRFNSALGIERKFVAVDPSDYYTPSTVSNSRVANQNLKGTIFNDRTGSFKDIDYLIIAPSFLQSQAQRLANYHVRESNLNVKVVDVQQIYTEFSEGKQDISAIRNFVKYVYDNASDPSSRVKYLNLFGDTSYDYKDRIPVKDNILPSFLSANSTSLTSSYVTDDFFTYMDPEEGDVATNNLMDIAVGRMIVSTQREAMEMVDKIESYTAASAFDKWRNNITLIGDDVDIPTDDILQKSVNDLGDEIFNKRPDYNVRKILLDSYNQTNTAGGERYPEAVEDIKNAFEQGSLVINYFGHGNEDVLAQEIVVTKSLVENLRNPDTLPLFIVVTCEFTKYDNPQRISGGELTYLNPQGGAIGLVATNRLIFVSVGVTFNNTLDQYLFGFDNVEPVSMAEALRLAKTDPSLASTGTRRVIAFIGDPALKLAFPSKKVVLTQVNEQAVNVNNPPLRALDKVSLAGEVQTISGNLISDYNGEISITVFDKELERQTLRNDDNGSILNFKQQGEVLFRGQATVENGRFTVSFVMPRDTQIPVGAGRVSFYAKRINAKEDQNGFSQDIKIGGINRDAPADDIGPEIELFLNDRNFVSGGITDSNPFILAFLNDMSGINTASGIGHDIIGIIDGDETNPFILNDYYEADVDDFTKGKVYFPLRDIAPGLHTLTVKSWDTYNNSSTQEIQFVVAAGDGIELTRVLNYPNPFSTYTEFWFNHNRPFEPLQVQVQVMTVTGKVVWTTNRTITTTGFTSREITWDGVDDFGQRLGKGVYIYKITVKSTLANEVASKIEKLVIL